MAEDNDRLRRLRLETTMVEYCVSAGWIAPEAPGYSDADLARACLIRDLREAMGVNDEGVGVALDLLELGLRVARDVVLRAGPDAAVPVEDAGPALHADRVAAPEEEPEPVVSDQRVPGLHGDVDPQAGLPGKRAFDVFLDCFHRGVLVRNAGDNLVFAPPYIVEREHIETMVSVLADAIKRLPD